MANRPTIINIRQVITIFILEYQYLNQYLNDWNKNNKKPACHRKH